MDEINASNSPQELALRFLLRHAECRRMLTCATAEDRQQPEVGEQQPETIAVAQVEAGTSALAEVVVTRDAPPEPAPEGSFSARFSQAYAAARQPPPSKRAADGGSRKVTGSSNKRLNHSASAAA